MHETWLDRSRAVLPAVRARVGRPSPLLLTPTMSVARRRAAHPTEPPHEHSTLHIERLWGELRAQRRPYGLHEHPYMTAWRAWQLSRSDLQILATEHDHVILAKAVLAHRAARLATGLLGDLLAAIAEEADADVERWRAFSMATGWCHSSSWYYGADPFPETRACVKSLTGARSDTAGQCVARLYALSTAQHDIASAQASALRGHYSMPEPSTEWFKRIAQDAALRPFVAAVDAVLVTEDPDALITASRSAYVSLWTFYDGVANNRVWVVSQKGQP